MAARGALGVLLLTAAVSAMPATASPTREYRGDCRLRSALEETHPPTGDGWWVHLYTVTAVSAPADVAANPVSATVTCWLRGVESEGGPFVFSGTGVVAGDSGPFRFFAESGDPFDVCTRVAYDDGSADESCVPRQTIQVPPQEVIDAVNRVFELLDLPPYRA